MLRNESIGAIKEHLLCFVRWCVISVAAGAALGLAGAVFSFGMNEVTHIRMANGWILWGLPLGGLLIVWLYQISGRGEDKGTNTVLEAIREEDVMPARVAPLIFVSTLITHLFGGSAGREGAALQIGGGLGSLFGRWLKLDAQDKSILIMCSMSAVFSSVFGTPVSAAIFSMEVVSVGTFHYAALVPCVMASLSARGVALWLGASGETFYDMLTVPRMNIAAAGASVVLAAACGAVSVLLCVTLHEAAALGKRYIPNPYLRVAAGGTAVVLLSLLLQTKDYLGAGMPVIEKAIEGEARPEAFLLKILLTAITLGAGYKGGEIVPTFFVGATFGCVAGSLLGLPASLGAAMGMTALFCGVTNSPLTSLLIAIELFGMEGILYFLIAVAVSYMLSGYFGLYHSQKFSCSKYRPEEYRQP